MSRYSASADARFAVRFSVGWAARQSRSCSWTWRREAPAADTSIAKEIPLSKQHQPLCNHRIQLEGPSFDA